MTNTYEIVKCKLECFKISYQINVQIGNIKNSYETEEEAMKDLIDIYRLSDSIYDYVKNNKHPTVSEE